MILEYLLLKIQAREIVIGDLLPSEGKLKIKFNCNRHTASNALKKLREKQLVNFVPGVGNFLVKTFEEEISIRSYINFTTTKSNNFNLNIFPIEFLSNFEFKNIQKSFLKKYFLDGINIAEQYIFINDKSVVEIKENNLFKELSYYGKTVHNVKKYVYLIDNNNGMLEIKDDILVAIKIQLLDSDKNEIIKIYNLLSKKYFLANKNTITF